MIPHRIARIAPCLLVVVALAAGLFPQIASSEDVDQTGGESLMTPAARDAARKALDYLARRQRSDGAWHCDVGFKLNTQYQVEFQNRPHVGVTALAGTAFLASGSTPGRGEFSDRIDAAVDFVLGCQDRETGFISAHGTRMYSHAFATMFLAEVYGMTNDARVRSALQRAVEFTYKAQNSQGGWRYVPNAEDSDMSITVCQVVALRAAKNKGIRVPKESIDAAVDYVLNSAVTRDGGFGQFEKGAFLYQYREGRGNADRMTRTSFALTSAGLTTLYGAGVYDDDQIRAFVDARRLERYRHDAPPSFRDMLDYVLQHYGDVRTRSDGRYHYFYFYGNYYAAQAMYIAGGRYWEQYYPRMRDDLVDWQLDDGSWRCNVEFDPQDGSPREYPMSTAIGAMILQVPNNYLPIFQR